LSPPLGAEGAALATVLAELVLALLALVGLTRHRPVLRPHVGVLAKVAVALAAGVAVALLVPAPPLVLSILAGAVYAAVALALRAVPPEAFNALLRRA
jgi:Na+-driven multidrug efflux pump